jgi:6-phosphofructokinase 1
MENLLKGACLFGQSGGPTSVINASAYGVFKTALESEAITRVLGAAHGVKGVLDDGSSISARRTRTSSACS